MDRLRLLETRILQVNSTSNPTVLFLFENFHEMRLKPRLEELKQEGSGSDNTILSFFLMEARLSAEMKSK